MDKRERMEVFRQRLAEAMRRADLNRSALGRATGVDRSTIGQLLNTEELRLPNAHLAAELAQALGVSCDWLLALSDRPERPGDLLAADITMSGAGRTVADEQILAWHREAAGYKVRHVPATLPDALKLEGVLRWEYADHLAKSPEQATSYMEGQQDWLLSTQSDYEIAVPLHEIEALAQGSGYYHSLNPGLRRAQMAWLAETCEQNFPALRLFLFDAHKVYSAPLTVFGPILAVLYVGQVYLSFRSGDRVRALTQHFDWLVREASVDARDAGAWIRDRL